MVTDYTFVICHKLISRPQVFLRYACETLIVLSNQQNVFCDPRHLLEFCYPHLNGQNRMCRLNCILIRICRVHFLGVSF